MFATARGILGLWSQPGGRVSGEPAIFASTFDYQNPVHLRVISDSVIQFKSKLDALTFVDYRILMGAAIGSVAYVGAYLFPVVLVSIAACCVSAYNLGIRPPIYKEYREALEDLIRVFKWSMGANTKDYWYKLAVNEIMDLISTLGPWVSAQTIVTWSHDDLKPARMSLMSRRMDLPVEFENKLTRFASGEQSTVWAYRLYGETGSDRIFDMVRQAAMAQIMPMVTTAAPRPN